MDDIISWLANVFAFPFILFVLALVAYRPGCPDVCGHRYSKLGGVARLVRGQVLSVGRRNTWRKPPKPLAATALG